MIDMENQYRLIEVPKVFAMQYTGNNVNELKKFLFDNECDINLIFAKNAPEEENVNVLVASDDEDWSSIVPINGWITLSETTWNVFSDSNFKQKYELVKGLPPLTEEEYKKKY